MLLWIHVSEKTYFPIKAQQVATNHQCVPVLYIYIMYAYIIQIISRSSCTSLRFIKTAKCQHSATDDGFPWAQCAVHYVHYGRLYQPFSYIFYAVDSELVLLRYIFLLLVCPVCLFGFFPSHLLQLYRFNNISDMK